MTSQIGDTSMTHAVIEKQQSKTKSVNETEDIVESHTEEFKELRSYSHTQIQQQFVS